jgi:hypothetical protein
MTQTGQCRQVILPIEGVLPRRLTIHNCTASRRRTTLTSAGYGGTALRRERDCDLVGKPARRIDTKQTETTSHFGTAYTAPKRQLIDSEC